MGEKGRKFTFLTTMEMKGYFVGLQGDSEMMAKAGKAKVSQSLVSFEKCIEIADVGLSGEMVRLSFGESGERRAWTGDVSVPRFRCSCQGLNLLGREE